MPFSPTLIPQILQSLVEVIASNAEEVTALDQAIGDGDHVCNLQRGLNALLPQANELAKLDWATAWQKIGMGLMSNVGGASGSLYGTLFVKMSKTAAGQEINCQSFAAIFFEGVEAVKQRGKADLGEKTMLDVLIPVADCLQQAVDKSIPFSDALEAINSAAQNGVESTRNLLATKGRASFLGERSKGHIDAGAKTAQLMICAITAILAEQSTAPA